MTNIPAIQWKTLACFLIAFSSWTTDLHACQVQKQSAEQAGERYGNQQYNTYYMQPKGTKVAEYPRLTAEFEKQRALMLSISDWQPHHSAIFNQIVKKTKGHIDLVVVHDDAKQLGQALDWLIESGTESDHVSFSQIPVDTIWVRDFAPIFAERRLGSSHESAMLPPAALDFYYVGGLRPKDERLPGNWAKLTNSKLQEVQWTLQGGNLLVNGHYLGLTTTRIFRDNAIQFPPSYRTRNPDLERRRIVTEAFLKECNLKMLVVLEPLQNEETKHCDMFATFLAPGQIVVASLDPKSDPVNAAILDRNAERLRRIKIGDDSLEVHRVRIPTRQGTSWSAFTNVIIANDLILMPVFDSDPQATVDAAVATYKRLLPNHVVKTVDMTSMKKLQGQLHCLSAQIPEIVTLPSNLQSFQEARKRLGK